MIVSGCSNYKIQQIFFPKLNKCTCNLTCSSFLLFRDELKIVDFAIVPLPYFPISILGDGDGIITCFVGIG